VRGRERERERERKRGREDSALLMMMSMAIEKETCQGREERRRGLQEEGKTEWKDGSIEIKIS
jgi:hypothetical protein